MVCSGQGPVGLVSTGLTKGRESAADRRSGGAWALGETEHESRRGFR